MRNGRAHWLGQRISAVLAVLVLLALAWSIGQMPSQSVELWREFCASLSGALLIALATGLIFFHATLGYSVIIEDYIANLKWRKALILYVYIAFALIFAIVIALLILLRLSS